MKIDWPYAAVGGICLLVLGYMLGARRVARDSLQAAYLQHAMIAVQLGDAPTEEDEKTMRRTLARVAFNNLGNLEDTDWAKLTQDATLAPGIGGFADHMARIAAYVEKHPELSLDAGARARILSYGKK